MSMKSVMQHIEPPGPRIIAQLCNAAGYVINSGPSASSTTTCFQLLTVMAAKKHNYAADSIRGNVQLLFKHYCTACGIQPVVEAAAAQHDTTTAAASQHPAAIVAVRSCPPCNPLLEA